MNRPRSIALTLSWLVLFSVTLWHGGQVAVAQESAKPPGTRTALEEYVAQPDSNYAWKVVKKARVPEATVYLIDMKSQAWRTPSEVDRTVWQHWLTVVCPDEVACDTGLLLIGGGANDRPPPKKPDKPIVEIALATRSVVAELGMVPNQPLVFHGDGKRRSEDDLVAYTWDQFLKTGDPTWPARNPMVKSAVRAMDTIQALALREQGGKRRVDRFVVAGGSKRGWTTWLTGAVDSRVTAIIPIVIDVLNVNVSMRHHHAAYGFWAPAVGDYERQKIMERMDTPEMEALYRLVDPFYYRRQLKMPKYIVNASGDQFFLPDSSQFYFDRLEGEKHLRYVPNADHSLDGSDALESIVAFYGLILADRPRPEYSWSVKADGSIHVKTVQKPARVTLWQATNPKARDFRVESLGKKYTATQLDGQGGGLFIGRVPKPAAGWTAYFVELTYDTGTKFPLKFTTQVRVVPDTLPFADKKTP